MSNAGLVKVARDLLRARIEKLAFVPAGGPGMGGDPAAGGMPPGDPAAGGGAPPSDPSAGGGAPPGPDINMIVQQAVQQAMMQNGGGGGGAGGQMGIKPKIDVNVEIMQIKNMLAKICDSLGVQIPAQDMVATPDKLNAMAMGQPTSAPQGGGGPPQGGMGGIPPMPSAGSQATVKQSMDVGEYARAVRRIQVQPKIAGHAFDMPNAQSGMIRAFNRAAASKTKG